MCGDPLAQSDPPIVLLRSISSSDLPDGFDGLTHPVVFEHTRWNVQRVDDLAAYVGSPGSATPASRLTS